MTGNIDHALELAVLAWGMYRPSQYQSAGVRVDDFASHAHQAMATALATIHQRREHANAFAMSLELQRAGKLDLVGGERGIVEMLTSSSSVADHTRLRELANLRRMHMLALEAAALCERGDTAGAVDAMERAKASATGPVVAATRNFAAVVTTLLEDMLDATKPPRTVHPGIQGLVNSIGRLQLGSLTVVGADSNVGKSQFALELMMRAADQGVGAGMISMEDPDLIPGSRALAALSGISSGKFASGRIELRDHPALCAAADGIRDYGDRLLLDNCVGGSDLDVCAAMSRQAERGAKIVVVDYLQEIECSKRQQDRRNEIRWLVNRLKTHAIACDVALVLLSQLSRPKDGETSRKPTKHHLKESGDTTASAEVILLMWRDVEQDDAPVHVEVAKCKWGGIGSAFDMRRHPGSGRLVYVDEHGRLQR